MGVLRRETRSYGPRDRFLMVLLLPKLRSEGRLPSLIAYRRQTRTNKSLVRSVVKNSWMTHTVACLC